LQTPLAARRFRNFSEISPLPQLLSKISIELTFENFYQIISQTLLQLLAVPAQETALEHATTPKKKL